MTKRILYLVPDMFGLPGGIARYCRHVCQSLLDGGFGVTVIALKDRDEERCEAERTFPGVRYYPSSGSYERFGARALWAALTRRPDIVLLGHPNHSPLGWALARALGRPLVVTEYGVEVWEPLKRYRQWALRRSDLILSISRYTAERSAQANGVPMTKVRLLPNCLDPDLQANRPPAKTSEKPSILTVARMSQREQYKGHDVVIRAMPALLQRFPHVRYDIVGDGDLRPALESLAGSEGVASAVRFHGMVSDDALRCFYGNASVFVMPSRGEGFGFVFLEAMAHGLPAIGGTADAAPEVIIDGKTGFLIDPTSVQAVVDTVSILLSDDELRQRMGAAGRLHVQSEFGFDRFRQRLLAHLAEVGDQR
jgi:glycosyltransferase involved in cell wall biosynthesis